MRKFGSNINIFKIKGITLIGNRNNNLVVGLDREGEELVKGIKDCESIDTECLSENQSELLHFLASNDFLNSKYEDRFYIDAAYLHVNSACNLHCLGCYSYVTDRNNKDELDLSKWVSIIAELKQCNIKNLVISGGEPFLRDDLVDICRTIKESQIHLEVISNGTMPLEKYEKVIPYIDALNISIDGYNEKVSFIRDKGIMDKVLMTIEELKSKVPIKLIVTLHKKNIAYMREYEKLAKKLGVFMSYSIFTVDFGEKIYRDYQFTENDFATIGDNISKSSNGQTILDTPTEEVGLSYREGCGFGKHMISIAYNGDIYPCHMLHCASCKLGNLREKKLADIMVNPDFNVTKFKLDDIEECGECEYKFLCGGACRGRAYLFTGNMKKKTLIVWQQRDFMTIFLLSTWTYNQHLLYEYL